MNAATPLPMTGLSLDDARRKLSGWHFAKEALSETEREVLYVAEGLLRLIDDLPEDADVEIAPLRALASKPGVVGVDLHSDGVEVCGSPDDSDVCVGFIKGTFTPEQVRISVGPDLPVTDHR